MVERSRASFSDPSPTLDLEIFYLSTVAVSFGFFCNCLLYLVCKVELNLVLFFSVVLFITFFRLDTHCTYSCIGTSGKNC